jgi:hypothetical protein
LICAPTIFIVLDRRPDPHTRQRIGNLAT